MKPQLVYDAIVVGGGVAGATAALRLLKQKKTVLVIEKEKKAKDKVCGEFFSGECQELLQEMGIDLSSNSELEAQKIHRTSLYSRNKVIEAELPFTAYGISRKRMDAYLLEQIEKRGGVVLKGEIATEVAETNIDYTSMKLFEVSAGENKYKSKEFFWATGKHDQSKVQKRSVMGPEWLGYKRHLSTSDELYRSFNQKIELHFFDGGYIGLSQIEDRKINVSFIIKSEIAKKLSHDWQNLLEHISKSDLRLKEIFKAADWLGERPSTIFKIPYGFIAQDASSFYRLGDQMAVIPSLTGDGMAMAMLTAKKAVESQSVAEYEEEIKKAFRVSVKLGMFLHVLAAKPFLSRSVIKLLGYSPWVVQKMIDQTRCMSLKVS